MTAVMLADGVLRVHAPIELPDGTCVDGSRDIAPDAPDYEEWLPHVVAIDDSGLYGHAEDEDIVRRWRTAASA
ncbi:hypothetical protein [Nonomuraea sp. NPDC049695]|uniref:hypothetical protein n=1 Tax=Nonomuraea sp. NPDC049695 TaxID=3154734 RepID=UPI003431E461